MNQHELHKAVLNLLNPKPPQDAHLKTLPEAHAGYYHFLYRLAEKLGTSLGYWVVFGVNQATCCSHIMAGHPAIDLIAIDQTRTEQATRMASKYGFRYHIHGSHDPKTEEYFQEHHNDIGVVFFDTTHIDWMVLGEWERVQPYLGDRAVLIFDDVHAAEDSVMSAVEQIPGIYIPADHLHPTLGFGIKVL